MAINFCQQAFHTKISSDKVSVDGHEAVQLISPGNKGFIAERFIRTPVNVICTFACNVDIQKVVICGKVGAQKSIGFEVFAYNERRNATKLGEVDYKFSDSFVCQSIGKLLSRDKTTFCFTNSRYWQREPFVGIKPMPSRFTSSEDVLESKLRSHNQRNLSSVSYLIVRILRTTAGSVPCVGWLEVWGQPSASSHAQIISDVFTIYKRITCPKPVAAHSRKLDSSPDEASDVPSELSIPDDFVDPITQDIMTLPMLLPSGHTVDQTTLDRHEKEEAQWGRSAGDPFTGVPFSRGNMPQQNTALKVRIDHFLLKHGSKVNVTNRTLGAEKIGVRNTTVSSLTKAKYLNFAASSSSAESDVPPPPKRLKTESTAKKEPVSTDLDSLLEEALSGLPRYTTSTPSTSSVRSSPSSEPRCTVCKTVSNMLVLYKLSCAHIICRICLMKRKSTSTKIQCVVCSKATDSCDIIKAHH